MENCGLTGDFYLKTPSSTRAAKKLPVSSARRKKNEKTAVCPAITCNHISLCLSVVFSGSQTMLY